MPATNSAYLNNNLNLIISEVKEYLGSLNPNIRNSPKDSQDKLAYSIRFLVTNALSVPINSSTPIAKSAGSYSESSTDYNPNLSYRLTVQQAYKALVALKYLRQTKNGWYKRKETHSGYRRDKNKTGERSQYAATLKLLKLFEDQIEVLPAILPPKDIVDVVRVQKKNPKKGPNGSKLPDIRLTPLKSLQKRVAAMSKNLARINQTLNRHWIDLEVPDADTDTTSDLLEGLAQHCLPDAAQKLKQWAEEGRTIPFHNRQIYRVFNDRKLTLGGRFYGGWWMTTPSVLRPYIIIDGKRTVEMDYGSIHPTILYALEGLERPIDAYDGILPKLPNEINNAARGVVKTAFMAMLNSNSNLNQKPDNIFFEDLKMIGMRWPELRVAIEARHPAIAHYFGTGIGSQLQKIDSDIAERVMLHFANMNIPILPVHDSFIMHHGYETELREIMDQAFTEVTGKRPKIDLTRRQQINVEEKQLDIEIDAILKANSWSCYKRFEAFADLKYN